MPLVSSPDVLVGLESPDDAGVVRLNDDTALVVTTDFFTPIVDDPRDFGRIAAANAISDIYAMGAMPLVALNIAAFPSKTLPLSILGEIMMGGAEVAKLAKLTIIGGHTIDDAEPKYGLAVVGTVHPSRIWRKGGAQLGDVLILTKALGTGVVSTALKRELLLESDPAVREMVRSMITLNATAAQCARSTEAVVHAATDVTGYGLVGHLLEMLKQSTEVSAVLQSERLPILPKAHELASQGILPGGSKSNRDFVADRYVVEPEVDPALAWLAVDAQTSGGLLFCVAPQSAEPLLQALQAHPDTALSCRIGTIVACESSGKSTVTLSATSAASGR